MSIKISAIVWEFSQTRHANRLLLLAIADSANDHGYAFLSNRTLQEKAQLSERQVRTGLRELEALGELVVSVGTGRGGCNEYTVALAHQYELRRKGGQGNVPPAQAAPAPSAPARSAPAKTVASGGKTCRKGGTPCPLPVGGISPNGGDTPEPSEEPSLPERADPLRALFLGFRRATVHRGDPDRIPASEFASATPYLAALHAEGVTPEEIATLARTAAATWRQGVVTVRALASNLTPLRERATDPGPASPPAVYRTLPPRTPPVSLREIPR